MNEQQQQHHRSTPHREIPEELVSINPQRGTAEVYYPDLLKAVDWLVKTGLADSHLKLELRRKAVGHG
jgi:hypothetical protein